MTEEDDFNLGLTSTIKESYDYILKDLDDAIAGLPTESKAGRLNKNAALALKSEVCLTAAAYTGEKALFQQAIDAVDAIQGYTLDSNYEACSIRTERILLRKSFWQDTAARITTRVETL